MGHSYTESIDGIDFVYTQGTQVPALVDPMNPSIVYPNAAVQNNDDVGLTVRAWYGLLPAFLGVAILRGVW